MRVGPGRDPLFFIAARFMDGTSPAQNRARARRRARRGAPHRRQRPGAAHRAHRRAGAARSRPARRSREGFRRAGRDGADHGRAPGRDDVDRRLRTRQPGAVAGVRPRGADEPGLPARNLLAGHRPAAGARIGFSPRDRLRSAHRDGAPRERAQALPRHRSRRSRRSKRGPSRGFACRAAKSGAESSVDLAIQDMAEARLVLTEDLIRATLRREKAAQKQAKGAAAHRRTARQKTEDRGKRTDDR